MGLRSWIKKLERQSAEHLESFDLLDGSRYYFGPAKTYKELYLHAYDVLLGKPWSEPPELYRKMCEARDVEEALERLTLPHAETALVKFNELYDVDALLKERRLVALPHEPPKDTSV